MIRGAVALAIAATACGRIRFDEQPTTASDASTLDAGLIHHWPIAEPPGAGAAGDVIGGADAVLMAPAAFVVDAQRGAALSSGAGGYAFTLAANDVGAVQQLTLSAWIRRAAPNMVEQVGQELAPTGIPGSDEISIQFWNDGLVYFCIGAGGACGTTPVSNDTGWHLATLVFDGSQPTDATRLLGYIDGQIEALSYVSGPVDAMTPARMGNFDLGAVSDNQGSDTGTIDEVRIYSRVLDASEIAALYANT
jgi:hypothetical protein